MSSLTFVTENRSRIDIRHYVDRFCPVPAPEDYPLMRPDGKLLAEGTPGSYVQVHEGLPWPKGAVGSHERPRGCHVLRRMLTPV